MPQFQLIIYDVFLWLHMRELSNSPHNLICFAACICVCEVARHPFGESKYRSSIGLKIRETGVMGTILALCVTTI